MAEPGTVRLTEIFYSLQGEGVHVGLPTVFIRLTGCSLRCAWCDTTYSFHGGKEWTLDEVVAEAGKHPVKRACVTGGEPLDQHDACVALVQRLLDDGYEVVLETSGALDLSTVDKVRERERLIVSMDVKCPASNMHKRNRWENLGILREHDQLKFVLSDERDYAYAKDVLAEHPEIRARNVLLQPMWESPDPVAPVKLEGEAMTLPRLADRVLKDGLDVRVGTQLHKVIWGFEKGR